MFADSDVPDPAYLSRPTFASMSYTDSMNLIFIGLGCILRSLWTQRPFIMEADIIEGTTEMIMS